MRSTVNGDCAISGCYVFITMQTELCSLLGVKRFDAWEDRKTITIAQSYLINL